MGIHVDFTGEKHTTPWGMVDFYREETPSLQGISIGFMENVERTVESEGNKMSTSMGNKKGDILLGKGLQRIR